ncbi:23614_t:CDS:2, partial [Gigaspora margarita]
IWVSEYRFLLPLFTIISAGHIEALYILSSKFGRLCVFSTTFSKSAENVIFWVGILDLIIHIPQFIIQWYFDVWISNDLQELVIELPPSQ